MARYIFITGGVVSSLGKGLSSASLGALLQARGFTVRIKKLDPYLNVDPGTMNPFQHGEVFVTEDGAETDLDLGHYERFTGVLAKKTDNITSGKIYLNVIQKERRGDYGGTDVQVVPHVTNEIKEFIESNNDDADFVICEIGGTIGDIESLPFVEAIRQFAQDRGPEKCMFIHVTLVPYLKVVGELKTKPTQHSVKELLSVGVQPDMILCRSDHEITVEDRRKISLFCNVPAQRVIPALDVDTIYRVPIEYKKYNLDGEVLEYFNMKSPDSDISGWHGIIDKIKDPKHEVRIAIVGKYTSLKESYKSIEEALTHGGFENDAKIKIDWIDSEIFEKRDPAEKLGHVHGVIVPGGFGERGSEGKMAAIEYVRENKIPYLGICFGMQLAVIEALRNVAGLKKASSSEFGQTAEPVVGLMTEWDKDGAIEVRQENEDLGGTLRLGAYPCRLVDESLAYHVYGQREISERHRHRYEVNKSYEDMLSKSGVLISGWSPDGLLPEIIERTDHPWFVGVQFHPEFKSKPFNPHPLFASFVGAAVKALENHQKQAA